MANSSTLFRTNNNIPESFAPFFDRGTESVRSAARQASRPWDRWLARKLMESLGHPAVGLELWDGFRIGPSAESAVGTVRLLNPSVLRSLILHGSVGFGEAFTDSTLQIQGDLVQVLLAVNRAMARSLPHWFVRWCDRWQRARHRHSLAESRSTVFHHYDIGNDFYRQWLDEQLTYTCAYFAKPELTLEEAQVAKFDHVCRKLRLRAGETVVEAGCGWGALALHMARNYGVRVQAFNLSREQLAHAKSRAKAEGLADRVTFIEDDYRNIRGHFDAFVSVGMLEHVGVERFAELGRLIERVLEPHGRGLIHTIGRNAAAPLDAWTDKYIFPGAEPPSLRQAMDIFEAGHLSVLDVENLRLHYAKTLEEWHRRFELAAENIENQLDARFVRVWRLYLCCSIATFLSGDLQLFQIQFAHAQNNDIPWTRADVNRDYS